MFLPENQKKLTNVVTVTLKRFNKKYEIAAYPNKLIDYKNGVISDLSKVILTPNIYSSVSKGELCSQDSLSLFKMDKNEILEEIIKYGTEQKNEVTRNYESSAVESEIVNFLQKRVAKGGKMVSKDEIKKIVKQFSNKKGNYKTQGLEILKIMVAEMGYEKNKMKIKVINGMNKLKEEFKLDIKDGVVEIETDGFREFNNFCEKNKIRFQIQHEEETEDEIIC